jgi:hypothetical protein
MRRPTSLFRAAAASAAAALLTAPAIEAAADPPPDAPPPSSPGAPDVAPRPRPDAWAGVARPWLYAADPTAPPPGHVLASLGAGYAQVDRGAARPFAANVTGGGAVFSADAEVGVFRFASLQVQGLLAGQGSSGESTGGHVNAGALIGAAFYPLPAGLPVQLSVAGGYLRELGGSNGVWGRASVAGNIGPVRLVVTATGSHVFAQGRDPVDLLLTTGATVAVLPYLRLGAEYVVQDLEGAFEDDELDGGVRHFLGPIASLELARRVHLTAGPSFGLSPGSPTVLGRVSAGYAF